MRKSAGARLTLVAESFARLAGRPLAEGSPLELALWTAPHAILAHGSEPDPLLFYANRVTLELFEITAAELIGLPSRLTAEPALRSERAKLFDRLERDHLVSGYSGVRVSARGRRFEISEAYVWNLCDAFGRRHGQAASFAEWRFLD